MSREPDFWPTASLELSFLTLRMPMQSEMVAIRAAGVSDATLSTEATYVKGACIAWFEHRRFDFDTAGERAFIVAARDVIGQIQDMVAWPIERPHEWATLHGVAFGLGEDQLRNPGTYFAGAALRMVDTPLAWLQAGGSAFCVLRPQAAWIRLRDAPRLACDSVQQGRALRKMLEPPKVEVMVPRRAQIREAA